jgi:phospholipid/cholesterol/gamma-HCH transport system permease protein
LGDATTSLLRLFFEWFGEMGLFCGRVARAAFARPYGIRELFRQLDEVGSKSVLLVAVAGAAIGVVLSLETRNSLIRLGAESSLPAVIIVSIIRETGPSITGLIVSGRVGAGIGAALGSMKVTDPYHYLAATRILACALMLPLLTLACDASGILMGWVVNTLAKPISFRFFLEVGLKNVTFNDFLPPTFKTVVFGLIIGVVSCFQVLHRSECALCGRRKRTTSRADRIGRAVAHLSFSTNMVSSRMPRARRRTALMVVLIDSTTPNRTG